MLATAGHSSPSLWEGARIEPVGRNKSGLAYSIIVIFQPSGSLSYSSPSKTPSPSKVIDYTSIPEEYVTPGRLQDARREIEKLAQTAHEENWDGEGASKLSTETIKIALKLVDTFPPDALGDDLDIDATPFGSIDFGWVLERDVMLNILVLSSEEIGFAYSVHGEMRDGKELWKGTLPTPVSEAFDRVFNQERWDG